MRRILRKFSKYADKLLAKQRKQKLNNCDFSIICNNCWAGYVYRKFALPYLTPTVGLYFFADDYVKFCHNLRHYMEQPLEFITYDESRYKDIIVKRKHQNVPIGRIGDVEIVFLHYKTEEEAREKWERRAKRINYDNLIFKFSKMNYCTEEDLKRFDELRCDKKICFVPPKDKGIIKSAVVFKSAGNNDCIHNDTSEYDRYINLFKLINSGKVNGTIFEE